MRHIVGALLIRRVVASSALLLRSGRTDILPGPSKERTTSMKELRLTLPNAELQVRGMTPPVALAAVLALTVVALAALAALAAGAFAAVGGG